MDRANYGVKDAQLVGTKALPSGAATIYSDGFDLGKMSGRGARLAKCELLLSAPLLTTTELPDAQTMKYDLQSDVDDPDFGAAVTLAKEILVQTGAGAAGAAAASVRVSIPTDCDRYIRFVATNSGAGDCTGKELTEELLF